MKKYIVCLLALGQVCYFAQTGYAQTSSDGPKRVAGSMPVSEESTSASDSAWEKALPIIDRDAKNGKPYIPWAATPKDLPQADIPAFPGAEGGGAYSFGGRGGRVFVVKTLADTKKRCRGSAHYRAGENGESDV